MSFGRLPIYKWLAAIRKGGDYGHSKNIINDNQFNVEELPAFKDKLLFEGAKQRVNLEQFAVLLFLSTAIATYGVIGDSVATVIGDMIIVPLMHPFKAWITEIIIN